VQNRGGPSEGEIRISLDATVGQRASRAARAQARACKAPRHRCARERGHATPRAACDRVWRYRVNASNRCPFRSVDVYRARIGRGCHSAKCQVIEVRVAELRQLFNAIDPSPFRERGLDPRAEEFIVDWSRDLPSDAPLALAVHLERAAGREDEAVILREAIHEFFAQRAAGSRRNLRQLFRRGRISLAIGLAFLASLRSKQAGSGDRRPGRTQGRRALLSICPGRDHYD
jgi:hypothetical protein